MWITKTCLFTGTTSTRFIKGLTPEMIDNWKSGTSIQDAMPNVDVDSREFIKTGCTPETWARMFPGEE